MFELTFLGNLRPEHEFPRTARLIDWDGLPAALLVTVDIYDNLVSGANKQAVDQLDDDNDDPDYTHK